MWHHIGKAGISGGISEAVVHADDWLTIPLDRIALSEPVPAPHVGQQTSRQWYCGLAFLLFHKAFSGQEEAILQIDEASSFRPDEAGFADCASTSPRVERNQNELGNVSARKLWCLAVMAFSMTPTRPDEMCRLITCEPSRPSRHSIRKPYANGLPHVPFPAVMK
jgi:hypothetical protein